MYLQLHKTTFLIAKFFKYVVNQKSSRDTGAQPELFQGRGGFVELGHFDKLFVKNTKKKALPGKILELFLLDTLKTTF